MLIQTKEVFYSLKPMKEMNARLKAIKTHYYTCFDFLGHSEISFTYAYMTLFNRWPDSIPASAFEQKTFERKQRESSERFSKSIDNELYSQMPRRRLSNDVTQPETEKSRRSGTHFLD